VCGKWFKNKNWKFINKRKIFLLLFLLLLKRFFIEYKFVFVKIETQYILNNLSIVGHDERKKLVIFQLNMLRDFVQCFVERKMFMLLFFKYSIK